MLTHLKTLVKWIISVLGIFAISLVTADTFDEFFKADSCFDSGGVYVADLSVCFNKAQGASGLVPDSGNMLFILVSCLVFYSIIFMLLRRLFKMISST